MTIDSARYWDAIADEYAAKPVADVAAFERKKEITRSLLRPSSVVLEVGCGTGSLALEMARSASHIHALDVSSEMLRIATRRAEAQGIRNVTFRLGTLDGSLPYERGSFDHVWAFSLLHLVRDRKHTLAAMYELLAPGGALVSSNVCLGDDWIPYRLVLGLMHRIGKAPAVSVHDRATLVGELREAGFVDVEERDVGAARTVAFIVARKPG